MQSMMKAVGVFLSLLIMGCSAEETDFSASSAALTVSVEQGLVEGI